MPKIGRPSIDPSRHRVQLVVTVDPATAAEIDTLVAMGAASRGRVLDGWAERSRAERERRRRKEAGAGQ